jgi:hypothetical protein
MTIALEIVVMEEYLAQIGVFGILQKRASDVFERVSDVLQIARISSAV